MKKRNGSLLAIVMLAATAVFVLAMTEVVTNGDFSSGLTGWTTEGAATAATDDTAVCGDEVARVEVDTSGGAADDGAISQCIGLGGSPGAGTFNWTLQADLRKVSAHSDTEVSVSANFYNSINCSGGSPADTLQLSTGIETPGLLPMSTSGSFTIPANSSVEIVASVSTPGDTIGVGCFDNISLTFEQPSAVMLSSIDAQSSSPAPWLIVMAVSALVLLAALALLKRKPAVQ